MYTVYTERNDAWVAHGIKDDGKKIIRTQFVGANGEKAVKIEVFLQRCCDLLNAQVQQDETTPTTQVAQVTQQGAA